MPITIVRKGIDIINAANEITSQLINNVEIQIENLESENSLCCLTAPSYLQFCSSSVEFFIKYIPVLIFPIQKIFLGFFGMEKWLFQLLHLFIKLHRLSTENELSCITIHQWMATFWLMNRRLSDCRISTKCDDFWTVLNQLWYWKEFAATRWKEKTSILLDG